MGDIFETDDNLIDAMYVQSLDQAKDIALQYISARRRTQREVIDYLQKKGYADAVIEEVFAFLLRYQYLDDAAYCRAWIHDKLQFHPCGRKKMAAELSKKIADYQLVQLSLEEYYSEEQELENAYAAAMQKMKSNVRTKQVSRQQLARFLYSRGYGGNIIETVLHTIAFSAPAEEF